MLDKNQMIIFKTEDEKISVDVIFDDETVWLSQDQMAELFERDKSTISKHIKNIFEEGELQSKPPVERVVCTTPIRGFYRLNPCSRGIECLTTHYNFKQPLTSGCLFLLNYSCYP